MLMTTPTLNQPSRWMKPLLLVGMLAAMFTLMFLMMQFRLFQPADATQTAWIPNATNTYVSFRPGDGERFYRFNARPDDVTRLKLDSQTTGFAFAAEVRDSRGETVAAFDGALQTVQIELAPDDGLYQLVVIPSDSARSGTIALSINDTSVSPVETQVVFTPFTAPQCSALNPGNANGDADVLVRSAPADSYATLGTLAPSTTLPAIGQTDNGWVAVNAAERQGWLRREVILLVGECAALPLLLNPVIPTAPEDAQVYVLEVDRDGEGSFHEVISSPQGDTSDLIWISIINLYTAPPNNYREFMLTLSCDGAELEAVRWGLAYSPTMACGQSVTMPFMQGASQQPFMVLLPEGSRQSYARYALSVSPVNGVG